MSHAQRWDASLQDLAPYSARLAPYSARNAFRPLSGPSRPVRQCVFHQPENGLTTLPVLRYGSGHRNPIPFMSQRLRTESQQKTQQRMSHRETRPASAQSLQGRLHPILQLQRMICNRRVAQLIQAKRLTPDGKMIGLQRKLTDGAADDQYEQEADRVARQVLNTSDAVAAHSMQRPVSPEEDKDQMLQTKPLAASITPFVQRRLVHNEGSEDKERPVQAKFFSETSREPLQRQPDTEEDETAGALTESFEAGADVETQVSQSKGRGSPVPDAVRTYMEPRFGVDFSQVRVHTGSDAIHMNRDVGAQAFTHGSDIYFGEGHCPSNFRTNRT